ncbi:MAG: hypothetical protein F4Y91_10715, partial [Gemmatimonadetes bacterium]|nr:hypothetical protein [Gemmatimonadota bacterium]
ADVRLEEEEEEDLLPPPSVSPTEPKVLEPPLAAGGDEKQRIIAALQQTNWIVSGPRGAARLLGLTEQTLRYRMRKYGIQRSKKV